MRDFIDENNEYFSPIAGANGTGKVVAEYYVNAELENGTKFYI